MIEPTKRCLHDNKLLPLNKYAVNNYTEDGRDFICKACRLKTVIDEETLKLYCFENQRPYDQAMFKSCLEDARVFVEKKDGTKDNYDAIYLKATRLYLSKLGLTSAIQGKMLSEKDIKKPLNNGKKPESAKSYRKNTTNNKKVEEKTEEEVNVYLAEKWGYEFDNADLYMIETLYNDMKSSFSIQTASQEDYLRKICIASVKGDKALRNDDVREAQKWMKMYDDLMKSSKMSPVQASAADAYGGVNTLSEITEMIERDGFIPQYPDVPRDDIDFAILCFINYNRKLINMNEVTLDESRRDISDIRKEIEDGLNLIVQDGDIDGTG